MREETLCGFVIWCTIILLYMIKLIQIFVSSSKSDKTEIFLNTSVTFRAAESLYIWKAKTQNAKDKKLPPVFLQPDGQLSQQQNADNRQSRHKLIFPNSLSSAKSPASGFVYCQLVNLSIAQHSPERMSRRLSVRRLQRFQKMTAITAIIFLHNPIND